MATKAQLIAALIAAGIPEAGLADKKVPELEALVKENVPDFNTAEKEDSASGLGADPRTGKKIKCRIEVSNEPGGKEPVFAAVNGFNFQAQRGKEIELDIGFVKHLEEVQTTDIEAVLNDSGKPTGEFLETPRRRFQVTRL